MRTTYKIILGIGIIYILQFEIRLLPHLPFEFSCKDPNLSHPFNGDTISARSVVFTSLLGPLVVISLAELLRGSSLKAVFGLYKTCFLGSLSVVLLTELIKSMAKRPRPHFLFSCQPDTNEGCEKGEIISEYSCTNIQLSSHRRNDLVRSFPSGHTSLSIFVAVYCSYVVLVRVPTDSWRILFKFLLVLNCVIWSVVCSVSRIIDKRHHLTDVLFGAALGAACAAYILVNLHKNRTVANVTSSNDS